MSLLQGKVAVITGAARGIGRAEALLFAREGARVVVNDVGAGSDGQGEDEEPARQVVGEIEAAGGEAVASFASVASRAGAEAIVATAVRRFGRIDVLVNNAGIVRHEPLLEATDPSWEAVLAVHLRGTFLCTQAAARRMVEQGGGGRIVNTTCATGLYGAAGQASYAAAKAGVHGLTRAAAIELERHGITVNALAPLARTRLTEDEPSFQGLDGLSPNHVAPAALFLASDLCADRSGQLLAVAGGRLYGFKLVETRGKLKDRDSPWTAAEIAEHWDAILR
jgi:NAD(P)-dependent dehydrogenase (short-subunit alcohol dehydrogenase family)